MQKIRKVAFIPARSGSKRIKDKNIKVLGGHPLLAYAIQSAIKSGLFDDVYCITDNEHYSSIATYYGAKIPSLRPKEISSDTSADIDWVKWALNSLKADDKFFDLFFILRPSSPFRTANTLKNAWDFFLKNQVVDSLRAVEKTKTHPGKIWSIQNNRLLPLLPLHMNGTPWHSNQYASLPVFFEQNASLEIVWVKTVKDTNTISGTNILPFISEGFDGFDLNTQEDWDLAEIYIQKKFVDLSYIDVPPFLG